MIGDPYRPVRAGQPLSIPATVWNQLLNIARSGTLPTQSTEARTLASRQTGVIEVRNVSGSNLDAFSVVGLDVVTIDSDDNLQEFKSRVRFDGDIPATSQTGFAILLEPLADGAIGSAAVAGVCAVQVEFATEADYQFADMDAGNTASLLASTEGGAEILWRNGTGAGTVWCVVRLGAAAPREGRVKITGFEQISANKYRYAGVEADVDGSVLTGGESWTGKVGESYILNYVEANNSASGTQGNSRSEARPIQGAPVLKIVDRDGDVAYVQYENAGDEVGDLTCYTLANCDDEYDTITRRIGGASPVGKVAAISGVCYYVVESVTCPEGNNPILDEGALFDSCIDCQAAQEGAEGDGNAPQTCPGGYSNAIVTGGPITKNLNDASPQYGCDAGPIDSDAGSDYPWDGTIAYAGGVNCEWWSDQWVKSWEGRALYNPTGVTRPVTLRLYAGYTTPIDRKIWVLFINSSSSGGDRIQIWTRDDSSPFGIYTAYCSTVTKPKYLLVSEV